MKKLIVLLAVSLVAASAFAQIDPDTNGIGVYFEPGAMTNLATWAVPYAPNQVYFCITNPQGNIGAAEYGYQTVATVGGFFRVAEMPAATSVEASQNHASPNAGEYITGYGSPLPVAGSVVLMQWTLMITTPGTQLEFFITGTSVPGLPSGLPAMVDVADGLMYPLYKSTGFNNTLAVAGVNNPPAVVAVEGASFGNVKSLFR